MAINGLFRKIPVEISLLIFQTYVTESQKLFRDWRDSPLPPFTLSLVCHEWRRITLANPMKWDTIVVLLPDVYGDEDDEEENDEDDEEEDNEDDEEEDNEDDEKEDNEDNEEEDEEEDEEDGEEARRFQRFRRCINKVELWIKRAGDLPVSIKLMPKDPIFTEFGFGCAAAKLVPQLIVKHASRIKELDLVISTKWYDLLSGVEFPNLQTLRLLVVEIVEQHNEGEFCAYLREAVSSTPLDVTKCPQLSVVQLNGAFEHSNIILPWIQIVDISLSYLIPNDCAQLFQQLPNLKRCALGLAPNLDDVADIDVSQEIEKRDQPLIEHLELDEIFPRTAEIVLKLLPLSLKYLTLGSFMKHADDYTFLLDTIPQFAETLQSLTIRYTFEDYDPILELLPQLPGLTSLEIFIDKGLDDRFTALLSTPGFLPRLERINIPGFRATRIGDQPLLDMFRDGTHRITDETRVRN